MAFNKKKKKNIFQKIGGLIGGIFSKKGLKRVFLVPLFGLGITVSVVFNDGKPEIDIDVKQVTPEQIEELKQENDTVIISKF